MEPRCTTGCKTEIKFLLLCEDVLVLKSEEMKYPFRYQRKKNKNKRLYKHLSKADMTHLRVKCGKHHMTGA